MIADLVCFFKNLIFYYATFFSICEKIYSCICFDVAIFLNLGILAKEPLGLLEINPQSNTVQKYLYLSP